MINLPPPSWFVYLLMVPVSSVNAGDDCLLVDLLVLLTCLVQY